MAAVAPVVLDTVTNLDAPKATEYQLDEEGSVLAVHVMPSGDVAAAVEPYATATNKLLP